MLCQSDGAHGVKFQHRLRGHAHTIGSFEVTSQGLRSRIACSLWEEGLPELLLLLPMAAGSLQERVPLWAGKHYTQITTMSDFKPDMHWIFVCRILNQSCWKDMSLGCEILETSRLLECELFAIRTSCYVNSHVSKYIMQNEQASLQRTNSHAQEWFLGTDTSAHQSKLRGSHKLFTCRVFCT